MAIRATLIERRGQRIQLDEATPAGSVFAKPSGDIYRVGLPADLAPGEYRLLVEIAAGKVRESRQLPFRVVPRE